MVNTPGVRDRSSKSPKEVCAEDGFHEVIQVPLLDVGQNQRRPCPVALAAVAVGAHLAGREFTVGVVVTVEGQADLLEVIAALHSIGRLAHLLHRGQQQADQHANDGNHHQQFDERERPTTLCQDRFMVFLPCDRNRELKRSPRAANRIGTIDTDSVCHDRA